MEGCLALRIYLSAAGETLAWLIAPLTSLLSGGPHWERHGEVSDIQTTVSRSF